MQCFCYQDSPRRAHSVAAQGGINAAKNYQNDGDSIYRLFHDTIKGGDFRSREANVYRLAQLSLNIIDQCVAQDVPFAREYGGLLDNRSFGGVQVKRTFYCRGQTGQQLLLGTYQALSRQIATGQVEMHPRSEMLDLVVADGRACGIITRDLVTGEIQRRAAHAIVLATGGYSNVYYLSTNAKGCNTTAIWRAYRRGAAFANPCFTQIHPTCIPPSGRHQSKLTLMSESLRNEGRIWVPKESNGERSPDEIPEDDRDYYLERKYPAYGNLVPRDLASRAAKQVVDEGRGVGPGGVGVYLDLSEAIERLGRQTIDDRYGNLFDMYQRITGDDPHEVPMRIYPAPLTRSGTELKVTWKGESELVVAATRDLGQRVDRWMKVLDIPRWRNGEEQSREVDLAAQERPRERRQVRRAWLGAMIRAAGDVGVEIARIYLDSPADKAGLKPGDRILQTDGEDVSSPQTVAEQIRRLEPGTKVDIVVDRDGEELTVEVEIGNLEDFHERLFGKRFRQNFDDFHEMFDPDFDGIPEGVFSFHIPSGEDDELTLRELLQEMRKELRQFRQESQESNNGDRDSANEEDTEAR